MPILTISVNGRCNARCLMCDIWKRTGNEHLTVAEIQSCLTDLELLGVQWIVLSGGEPLMHPHLFEICRMLQRLPLRITLLSTGFLLERYAQEVASHTNDVIVSLDGPPEVHEAIRRVAGGFAALERGIRALQEVDASFAISARCTVQRRNHADIVETVETARALGLRSISFLAADVTSEAFNRADGWTRAKQEQVALTIEEINTLKQQFEEIAARWDGTGFVLEGPAKLRRIVRRFEAQAGLCEPEAPRCNAPWVSAVVETDGAVRPCFFQPVFGSFKHQNLLSILNGPQALAFRQSLDVESNAICRRCVCSLYREDASN